MVFEFISEIGGKWIILYTIIFAIIYQCVLKYWSYFSRQNVKFVRGVPLLGTYYEMFLGRKSITEIFRNIYQKFPKEKFLGMYDIFGTPVYLIRDPDLINQISIKDFDHFINRRTIINESADAFLSKSLFNATDQKWRDMRATISPAFTGAKMRSILNLVVEVLRDRCEYIKQEMGDHDAVAYDLQDKFQRIIGDTIASSAFGIEVNSLKDTENDFYRTGKSMVSFSGIQGLKFLGYATAPTLMGWLRIKLINDKDLTYFKRLVVDLIEHREKNNIVRQDVINLLIEGRKTKKFDDMELVSHPMIFFFGGFSSITIALGFVAYSLAMNPDIQERLLKEILEVKEELKGEPLSYEAMGKMKYTDMVITETLRRWSLATGGDRIVTKPYVIENSDGNKIRLNPGDAVWFMTDSIAMDPKYFPNPEKFDPERFNEENKSNITTNTYMPFGVGPRMCVASRFALMEVKAAVYYLFLNFKIEKCARTQDPFKVNVSSVFTEPSDGFWLKLRKRKSAA